MAAGAGLAGCLAVALRDPHRHGSWGFCPFLALTGLPCPLCGGLRAVNDLAHGRLVEAVSTNLLVVAALVTTTAGVLWWAALCAAGTGAEPFPLTAGHRGRKTLMIGVPLLVVAFGVARWLPSLAWAAP